MSRGNLGRKTCHVESPLLLCFDCGESVQSCSHVETTLATFLLSTFFLSSGFEKKKTQGAWVTPYQLTGQQSNKLYGTTSQLCPLVSAIRIGFLVSLGSETSSCAESRLPPPLLLEAEIKQHVLSKTKTHPGLSALLQCRSCFRKAQKTFVLSLQDSNSHLFIFKC